MAVVQYSFHAQYLCYHSYKNCTIIEDLMNFIPISPEYSSYIHSEKSPVFS